MALFRTEPRKINLRRSSFFYVVLMLVVFFEQPETGSTQEAQSSSGTATDSASLAATAAQDAKQAAQAAKKAAQDATFAVQAKAADKRARKAGALAKAKAAKAAKAAAVAVRTGEPSAAAKAGREAKAAERAAASASTAAELPPLIALPPGALAGTYVPTAPRHWIIYDAADTSKNWAPTVCDGASIANLAHCVSFPNPEANYFISGSLIYVVIEHVCQNATYAIVDKSDVQIAEDRPLVNGVPLPNGELERAPPPPPPCSETRVLLLGQYSNDRVSFSICESIPGRTGGTPCPSSSSNAQQGVGGSKGTSKTSKCPCPTPSESGPKTVPGNVMATTAIEVHKLYRANIVAGFFVSKLVNRQYGLTNNGQSTSTSNLTYVTVVGPTTLPQYHAYVGVNVYPWRRDVFPGAMSHQGFLWAKEGSKGLNGYWNPGVLVGYGVDATNNYLVGLNWETFWGINIGSGVHIGQEARLQPGIVPGVTQLPSSTTAAPTYNKTEYGWYGSIGFDLSVMKAALSQLFGGGGGSLKTGQ